MVDNIEGIRSLINKDHCKPNYDLHSHDNAYFTKTDLLDKSFITLTNMDADLESIMDAIRDDELLTDHNKSVVTNTAVSSPQHQQPQLLVVGNIHDDKQSPIYTSSNNKNTGNNEVQSDKQQSNDVITTGTSASPVPIDTHKLSTALKSYNETLDVDIEYDNTKYIIMEEIEEFQDQLVLAGVMTEHKYIVTVDTPLRKLQEIREILKIKYDKSRFTTTGIKAIELMAFVMEKIFDGTRSIGSFNMNLTGWHKTMKLKARYLQTDIAECVETYISPTMTPGARIFFDVFLNMILYGTTNHISKTMNLQDIYNKFSD